MKLKKIFLLLGITIGGFLSCTSESVIEESLAGSQEVSILLTSGNVVTKAEEAPSDLERKINDCHVAIFNAEGARIFSTNFSSMGEPDATVNGLPAYTLSLGDVRTFGRGVKSISVYVLANAGDYTMFDNCSNYAEYQQNGLVNTSVFSADNLVKTGLMSETLEYSESSAAKEICIPLTQLSARVDFLGVEVEGLSESGNGEWQVAGEALVRQWNEWPSTYREKANKEECKNWLTSNGDNGRYNSKHKPTKRALLYKQTRTRTISAGAVVSTSSYVGINTKSAVTIYDNTKVENTMTSLTTRATPFTGSFYTYENGGIRLTLGVSIVTSATETQERYCFRISTQENAQSPWSQTPEECSEWESLPSTSGTQKTYTLDLPSSTFVKGNIYQVKGKVNPKFLSEFNWEVIPVPLENIQVNPPAFD